MFGKTITLFRLFGFRVRIDLSWFLIAALVAWSLAVGAFPLYYENLSAATYWWMGIGGALALFVSIVVHELCHSLAARRYGMEMRGITLFVFGGVAEMTEEPSSAVAEFVMALAGPASSIALGGLVLGLHHLGTQAGWPVPLTGVLSYMGLINLVLAGFNLLPAFPLDGGRVFRAALWAWRGNLRWATRIASVTGSAIGLLMVAGGVLYALSGALIGGLWLAFIGMFIRGASRMSYQQLLTRKALEGEKVRRFMRAQPVTVPGEATIADLVEDYVYTHHFKMLPVVEGERLLGCVTTRDIKEVPRAEWSQRRAGEIARTCSPENTISPDQDVTEALSSMHRTQSSRLMVVEDGCLVGVLALKDLLEFLSLKVDLEGDSV